MNRRPHLPHATTPEARLVQRILSTYPHAQISAATAITRPSLRRWHDTGAMPSPAYRRALAEYHNTQR